MLLDKDVRRPTLRLHADLDVEDILKAWGPGRPGLTVMVREDTETDIGLAEFRGWRPSEKLVKRG